MGLFNKKIKDCKGLDKYKINIDDLLSIGDKSIKLIGENEKYAFYDYEESGNHYILRQNKFNRKEVVSFDSIGYYDIFCLWNRYLIMAMSGDAEVGFWDGFVFIDTETGERKIIKFRSEYGNMVFINGYGRRYNQDTIKKMYSKNDTLIIEFSRRKYTQKDADKVPYNEDMDYILYVKNIDGELSTHRTYEDEHEHDEEMEEIIEEIEKDSNTAELSVEEYCNVLSYIILTSADSYPKLCKSIDIEADYLNHLHFCEYFLYISKCFLERDYSKDILKMITDNVIDIIIDSVNYIEDNSKEDIKNIVKEHYSIIEKKNINIFTEDGLKSIAKLFQKDLGIGLDAISEFYIYTEFSTFIIYHIENIVNKKIIIKNQQ